MNYSDPKKNKQRKNKKSYNPRIISVTTMILTRLGNKRRICKTILRHLPPQEEIRTWIEPFFGAGGMFFNKPKSKYNILNDQDSEVFNLFMVVREQKEALEQEWLRTPVHNDLWNYWKTVCPTDPVSRAVRFLYFSNLGFLGKPDTLRFGPRNTQKLIYERLDITSKMLFGCQFMNCDFRDVFRRIVFRDGDMKTAFCYCDPPYLDTTHNYQSGFTYKDSEDLFDLMMSLPIRWAMSEFDHPFILDQARSRGLNVITLTERQNLNNRRTEILVTNYENRNPELFHDNELF